MRAKTYNVGELVLRLPEKKKDKLKPKWEGPFIIDKVLTVGAYCLRNASDNRLEPNPWNADRLRRFYAKCRTQGSSPYPPSFNYVLPFSFLALFSFFTQSIKYSADPRIAPAALCELTIPGGFLYGS